MKNCPYCNATIEENARVCLYCMKELEPKAQLIAALNRPRRLVLIICCAVFACVIGITALIFLPKQTVKPPKQPDQQQTNVEDTTKNTDSNSESQQSNGNNANQNNKTPNSNNKQNKSDGGSEIYVGGPNTTVPDTTVTTPQTDPEKPVKVSPDQQDTPNQEQQDTPNQQQQDTPNQEQQDTPNQEQQDTPKQEQQDTPVTTTAVYTYRDAEYAIDDYLVTSNVDNCVVITGVSTPAADGIYRVPSTIDGKKVIAIQRSAFNGENVKTTVKQVYLPETVRTVWEFAFSGCVNLTDIYLGANSIHVDIQAFASKEKRNAALTIHCSYNCNNRDFRYYRNIASSYYDAVYEEWNG